VSCAGALPRALAALALGALSACGCGKTYTVAEVCGPGGDLPWGAPRVVSVVLPDGTPYGDDVEEPEVRDFGGARWLFFNDDPKNGNKDLFYARWDDPQQAFVVLGRLPGTDAQSPAVDGNPSLSSDGGFFFVSTRTFPSPTETIYAGTFAVSGVPPTGTLTGITRLDGLSRPDSPWASQGVQVTWDGAWLFFDEAKFDGPVPSQSDLVAARRSGTGFTRLSPAELSALFANVNTSTFLEYAESLSRDGKELYFTRTWADPSRLSQVVMCVMRSARAGAAAPFEAPVQLAVTAPTPGAVMEAPSLSPDEKTLYYHRREPGGGAARLMAVDRP
jgi:hypothetical protein